MAGTKNKTPQKKKGPTQCSDPHGMFAGMVVFLIETGVQARRLQIWKDKLVRLGATIEDYLSKNVTHIFVITSDALLEQVDNGYLARFKGKVLRYQWLEDCLRLGEKLPDDSYGLKGESEKENKQDRLRQISLEPTSGNSYSVEETSCSKRLKSSHEDIMGISTTSRDNIGNNSRDTTVFPDKDDNASKPSLPYCPPDLNKNITEIFGKLINIYRALGDDRRSFSYQKAIPVIEKLDFKIESAEQVKHLPSIGKAMQEHIQEIVTTGKLSKLEHFETDEKVRTISLFGEVWGIGPATALKLYDKGYRTLDDLKNDDSLTHAQKIGLKYFDDINTRIPRHEVQEMELLLQKVGEEVLPGVIIVCGGSYRRGKATCGDMDIIVTHPDGQSHRGFLKKYVRRLKEMNFVREDLVFTTHSEVGTDSGVDTYFGLCTYPGRELRHRIDFKVYPRDIYAFGLIAWTGNDVLNRRLRILAESKGYRLDDTGLFLATQTSGGKRGTKASTSLNLKTEKEVFDFLGFPWFEPHERNL